MACTDVFGCFKDRSGIALANTTSGDWVQCVVFAGKASSIIEGLAL